MSVTLVIEGLDKIQSLVDPAKFDRAVARGLDRSVQIWRDDVKTMPAVSAATTGYGAKGIPVDTGRLRQSVQARRTGLLAAGVVAPLQYASYVEEGTSKMPARPFFEWALELGALQKMEDAMNREITRSFDGQ